MSAPPPRSALLLCALLLCGGSTRAGVVISEVMADNATVLADADGDFSDWLELHNTGTEPADLNGWTLTDDPLQPARWTFPAVTLPAGGYLVVFCSGKDRANAGQPLHTGFRLDRDGEYLALHAPGNPVPMHAYQPSFPPLPTDVSCGPASDTAGAPVVLFSQPTPGAANVTAGATSGAVSFSEASRTFTGTLQVSLSTGAPAAAIHYTLDGSMPGTSSVLYTAPVVITGCTTLRALAIEPGKPAGPVRTEIYYALDSAAAGFSSPLPLVVTHGNAALPLTGERLPATLMIFTPSPLDGLARLSDAPALVSRCQLSRRGNSTLDAPKYSMDVEFTGEDGEDRDASPAGLPEDSDWVLHAAWEHDRSLLRDDLIYRLSRDAGRYAPRTRHVELFHAGTEPVISWTPGAAPYAGIYSLMEKIKRGAQRVPVERLKSEDSAEPDISGGYILKIDRLDPGDSGLQAGGHTFGLVYPKENSTDPNQMATAAQKAWIAGWLGNCFTALASPSFSDPQSGYASFMDAESFADHHLFSVLAKNVDAFRQSEFMHKPRSGRLVSGPLWDFDRSMGSTDGRDLDPMAWRGVTGDGGTDYFHHGYYDRLFDDPAFWQLWVDRLGELRAGAFSVPHIHAVVDELAAGMAPQGLNAPDSPVMRNFLRWPARPPRPASPATPGTDGTWAGEVAWLKNWWSARLAFTDSQFTVVPSIQVLPGSPITFTLSSPSLSRPGAKIYYTTSGGTFRDVQLPVFDRMLLREDDPFTATVPTGNISPAWHGADLNADGNHGNDFDDSGWHQSSASARPWQVPGHRLNGAGYDDSTSGQSVNYLPFINIRWSTATSPQPGKPAMRGVTNSCYLRYRFTISPGELSQLTSLRLRARYDDGFVAYLNGTEILRQNEPAGSPAQSGFPPQPPTPLSWDSSAGNLHTDEDAVSYDSGTFLIPSAISLLVPGMNVLAVHGLNVPTGSPPTSSSDFLFQCQLEGSRSNVGTGAGGWDGAAEYTGPVTLTNGPVQITARTFDPAPPLDPAQAGFGMAPVGTGWSAPLSVWLHPGASPASAANLRIAEIHYHPAPLGPEDAAAGFSDPDDFEFLRLENFSSGPVDLTGISFVQGVSWTASSAPQNWLPAGASAVLVKDADAHTWRNGPDARVIGTYTGSLADQGERLVLLGASGSVIADFAWHSVAPWPVTPAGGGPSLCWKAGPAGDAGSWMPSADPGGVPFSFSSWLRRYFAPAAADLQTPADDPDGDGMNNLAEFALGQHPARADQVQMSAAAPQGGQFSLSARRRRNAADVTWTFQISGPAGSWLDGGPPQTIVDHGDGTETAVWSTPATAPGLFVRLKVSVP